MKVRFFNLIQKSLFNIFYVSVPINILLGRVKKTELMLTPGEVESLKDFEKLYEVFELAVSEFQSEDVIISHLAVAFYDDIQTKLHDLGNNQEFSLKQAAMKLKDFARNRLDLCDEFLAAAVLHPQQCESSYLLEFLSAKGSNRESIIIELCEKYELDTVESTNDSSNSQSNSNMVSCT